MVCPEMDTDQGNPRQDGTSDTKVAIALLEDLVATNRVEAPDAGLASGILNTAQQMGATVGLAVLSTLAASRTLHGAAGAHTLQIGGFHLAFDRAAAFPGAALLITAFMLRSEPEGATREEVHRDKAAQAAACAQQVPGAIR
jgi:hypothetical protein